MNAIATFVPAQTETKTIEVAPAKVVLELTPRQAQQLRALIGETTGADGWAIYDPLARACEAAGVAHTYLPRDFQRAVRGLRLEDVPQA